MNIKCADFAPEWLVETIAKAELVGEGAHCQVLASPVDGRVVKLSRAKADLTAHEALAKTSRHFPATFRRCDSALFGEEGVLHALELEKVVLAPEMPLQGLADFLYRHKEFRLTPLSSAAAGIRSGERFASGLPSSLGDALDEICRYAAKNHGLSAIIDLYTFQNWGVRADGTLVVIDPMNLAPEVEAGHTH